MNSSAKYWLGTCMGAAGVFMAGLSGGLMGWLGVIVLLVGVYVMLRGLLVL